jgi:hypothetical protein
MARTSVNPVRDIDEREKGTFAMSTTPHAGDWQRLSAEGPWRIASTG